MQTFSSSPMQRNAAKLRILVVEDNHDTREMVCELLRLLGHAPHGVGNAEQALTEADRHAFDILFTDISLPGMSGIELAKNIVRDHPTLGIILASGYQVDKEDVEDFDCETLVKPYDLEQLQSALRTAGKAE